MTKNKVIFLTIVLIFLAVFLFNDGLNFLSFKSNDLSKNEKTAIDFNKSFEKNEQDKIKIIAQDLNIPWEIVFLPDGDMLVTERTGTLKRIGEKGGIYKVEGVEHIGEGGLLGMALHPDFEENKWIYLYVTTKKDNGLVNRVERYSFDDHKLLDKKIIIDNIPGAIYHDGGRMAFGPDGYLYITTGDARRPKLAQDINSLAGKILRLDDNGRIPKDNPFGNAVYSYGHRNPQGLSWDSDGNLWATEHGRSGALSGYDELNLIEKGKNYGWPEIQGSEEKDGMVPPVIHSGPKTTWAPAGALFWNGNIFFTGLRGSSLYKVDISKNPVVLDKYLENKFGRLRVVVLGPDGYFYLATSNRDGRGELFEGDDKIIRVDPDLFR